MHLLTATESTPGQPNEDYLVTGPSWAVLLDGATAPNSVDSGCIHDVPWLVQHLAGNLAHGLTTCSSKSLPELLASAIRATCAAHADTCDLTNPASPSATVTTYRVRGDCLEYLVLGDSSLLFDMGDEVRHITDDRTDHLADYSVEGVRAARNVPSTPQRPSFWVASTKPEASEEAITGDVPMSGVKRVALLSDGASRWTDRFSLGKWTDLLSLLTEFGPVELIRQVRSAESAETPEERLHRRGKRHDDATAALAMFDYDTPVGADVGKGEVRG